MPEFPTLDDIGACLEDVYTTLYTRVETLSRHPPSHGSPAYTASFKSPQPQISGFASGESAASTALAHETLKKDAKQLSAALSRSQKRAETLEKKMLAFENENDQNVLDRERLVANVEMLEETVDELRKERDEVRVELQSSGGQWLRIIGNAAKLERGLWLELKKRRDNEAGDKMGADVEGPGARCEHCAGAMDRLLDTNRALKQRVDVLECSVERMSCGSKEMGALLQRLGVLGGQLDGEIAKVMAVSTSICSDGDGGSGGAA